MSVEDNAPCTECDRPGSTTTESEPRTLKLKPILVLVIMATLSHIALAGARITLILDAVHLNASPAVVGVISALLAAVGAFIAVPVGRWIDRSGVRIPMLIGCVACSIGMLLGFIFPGLFTLFIISVIVGTGTNIFFIASQNLVGQYGTPDERVSNFSQLSLGYSCAAFIGPIVAGFSIDALGHPVTFLLLALVPLLPTLILVLDRLPAPPPRPSVAKHGGQSGGSSIALIWSPQLAPIFTASVLSQATWNLFGFLMPIHLANLGLSASAIGSLVASFYFASMVSRMFLPWIVRRFTPWQLLVAAFAGGSLSFIGFTLTGNIAMLVILSMWLGTVLGFTGPMILTLMHEASPPDRAGEVVGLRVMLMNTCQTIIPLLTGALGAAFGVAPAFWALSAALMGGGWSASRQSRLHDARARR